MYSETAYLLGIVILAIGTVFMEKADLGMSMVVAPAYLIYRKVSQTYSWFSFGMAEYCLQAFLLILTGVILRRFKLSFLFSFVTAVVYGMILDLFMWLGGYLPQGDLVFRIVYFLIGMVLGSLGVAFLFHTYVAPEAYELLVKEVSASLNKKISVVKTIYDCSSCLVAIILSFCFFGFGKFEGVKVGTIICALVNGWMIGQFSRYLESKRTFAPAFQKLAGLHKDTNY